MKFKNTKTGVVIDLTAPISGGNWVAIGEVEEKPTPKVKQKLKSNKNKKLLKQMILI